MAEETPNCDSIKLELPILDSQNQPTKLPYSIQNSPELGRYLVATRDIQPLEIIIKEKPIVSGPSDSSESTSTDADAPKCLGCCRQLKNENKYNRCSKCRWPVCNEECEKLKNHAENECKYFSANNVSYPPPFTKSVLNKCILILRMLLCKYQNNNIDNWNRLVDMESHMELRKIKLNSIATDDKILANFETFKRQNSNSCNGIMDPTGEVKVKASDPKNNSKFPEVDCFSNSEILKSSGIIDTNAHVLPQKISSETTCQIFPNSSLLSHHCCPNAEWSIEHSATNTESEISLITRATIVIKTGQTINVCYDDSEIMYGTLRRLIPMEIAGLFICKCSRCVDPTELSTNFSSIKCTACKPGYLLPKNPVSSFSDWKCNVCQSMQTDEEILDIVQALEEQVEFPRRTSRKNKKSGENVKQLELFVSRCSGRIVHPNHFILQEVRLRIIAEESASLQSFNQKKMKIFVERCEHVFGIANILSPGLSEYRTISQFHLARGLLMMQRRKEQKLGNGASDKKAKGLVQAGLAGLEIYKRIYQLQKEALSYFKIGKNKRCAVLEKDLEYVKSCLVENFDMSI